MFPTVPELRLQCRIDSDDSTEDQMLSLYLKAAVKHSEIIVNSRLYENEVPAEDPNGLLVSDDIKLALMLLVSHWYENREPVNIGNITTTLPFGIEAILKPYRIRPGT